jgi:protein TonB
VAQVQPVMTNPAAAPVEAPSEIRPESGITGGGDGVPGGVEGGIPGGVVGGVVGGIVEAPPPPPPPPPPAPVRVGGNIKPPTKTRDVRPSYPPIAQSARVQGVVIIEATIGPNGRVQDARVLRSIPLLDQAALDAVRQWEYTPTLLNGVPVPVIMTVTVNFTLQ